MLKQKTTLSNSQIVTLAVSMLDGVTKAADVEDIAIQAYEIAPDKFAWRKYPDRIDLRVVQYALKDAISIRKNDPLLKGSVKHGYMLTGIGLEWVAANQQTVTTDTQNKLRKQSVANRLSIEQSRLLTSHAYRKFKANGFEDITYADFEEFSRVNDYFPDHIRRKRFAVIENVIYKNSELENLWALLIDKFIEGKPKND